jgi:hypothetical protein
VNFTIGEEVSSYDNEIPLDDLDAISYGGQESGDHRDQSPRSPQNEYPGGMDPSSMSVSALFVHLFTTNRGNALRSPLEGDAQDLG